MSIRFVLVEPKVPENIGASARAIKTMGFSSLVLVNPARWPDEKSKWVAHGSSDILDEAVVFKSLEEALSDSDFAIATSAKERNVKQNYIPVRELREFIDARSGSIEKISVVFGREESGLTNEEIKLCDISSTVPMSIPYPSLNLSQAVMLFAYELSGLNLKKNDNDTILEPGSMRNLKKKVKRVLSEIGINEEDNIYGRIMERVSFLNNDDMNLMHSVTGLLEKNIIK